jgi:hypothetical protein
MVVVGINALCDGLVKGGVRFTSLYGSPYYHLPPINLCLLSFTNLVELRIILKTPATGRSPLKNGPGSMLDRAKELAESPAARSMKHLDRIVVMMMMDGIVLQVTCIAGAWIQKSPRPLTSATATNTHTTSTSTSTSTMQKRKGKEMEMAGRSEQGAVAAQTG